MIVNKISKVLPCVKELKWNAGDAEWSLRLRRDARHARQHDVAVGAGGEDELVVELVEADAPDPVGVVGAHSQLLVRLPNVPEPDNLKAILMMILKSLKV